ncbi:MAG: DUF2142 domain-containing protein [Candidatus Gastranaerophilaceae bacterium]
MIKQISIEKFFIYIALIFGCLYVFLLPPFQSVDEASHFYRSYGIISNKLTAENIDGKIGDYLPKSLETVASGYDYLIKNIDAKTDLKKILNSKNIKLDPDKVKFIKFTNTALYSPTCYLTQIPGMYIAKILKTNPLIFLYAGRLSNLIFFSIIVFFAIKNIPFFKMPMMLLALMPMTLSINSALTSDTIIIGLNFLWVSLILKTLYEKKISKLNIVLFMLIAFLLSISKYYFLLIPLIFLLPKSLFKNWKQYILFIFGIAAMATAGILIWQHFTSDLLLSMNGNANANLQLEFIKSYPLNYLAILLKTFIVKTPRIIITMIGVLGWQDTHLDFMTYIAYPILIYMGLKLDKDKFKFTKWQYSIILFDVIFSIISIYTCMYLMWSGVGSGIIYGLNGKYFIPLMIPIFLLFKNKLKYDMKQEEITKLIICLILILILISSDLSILHRFYNITPNLYYKI